MDERSQPVYESFEPKGNECVRQGYFYMVNELQLTSYIKKLFWRELKLDDKYIRIVKCAKNLKDGRPIVVVEISKKAFKNNNENNSAKSTKSSVWDYESIGNFDSGSSKEGKNKIPQYFYDKLRNKVFYGENENLHWTVVERRDDDAKDGKSKFFRIELDPKLTFAYIFNINMANPLYRLSSAMEKFVDERKTDDLTGRQSKAIQRKFREYQDEELTLASMYLTFTDYVWTYRNDRGEEQKTTGFHPSQLKLVYSSRDNKKKKKKHHKD